MGQRTIFISFIVPVYNGELYVEKCLNSILAQTNSNYEIIVVDDGSTDGTPNILERIGKCSQKVRVITQENMGVSAARNRGVQEAVGQWISFVDVDDVISDSVCELFQQQELEDIDIAFGKISVGKEIKANNNFNESKIISDKTALISMLLDRYDCEDDMKDFYYTSACAKLFRKSFLLENNIVFNTDVVSSEDFLFNLEAYVASRKNLFVFTEIYQYCFNPSSATHSYNETFVRNFLTVSRKIKFILDEKKMLNDTKIYEKYLCRLVTNIQFSLLGEICHVKNKSSFKERKKQFDDLLLNEEYRPVFENKVKYDSFPGTKKIVAFFVIHRNFILIDFLIRTSEYLKGAR